MNKTQKQLIVVALVIFVATVLYSPWSLTEKRLDGNVISVNTVSAPIFSTPTRQTPVYSHLEARLCWTPLVFTWIALAIVSGGVFALLGNQK